MNGPMITVARGWGGRQIQVAPEALDGFHITTETGGVNATLPRPMWAAYMWCDRIPQGADFGHSCRHGPPPHRILVLIPKYANRTFLKTLEDKRAKRQVTA